MRIPAFSAFVISALLAFQTLPVASQETSPAPEPTASPAPAAAIDALPVEFLFGLMNKGSVEEFTAGMVNNFRNVAGSDGVLNAQVIADRAAIQAAEARASKIKDVLRADLDGDGSVTRAEMEKSKASRQRGGTAADQAIIAQQINVELERAMAPDANTDGVITFDEMRQSAAISVEAREDRRGDRAAAMLAMDSDGDGSVTLREVRAASQKIFASFDTDGDGEIGDMEQKMLAEQLQAMTKRQHQRTMIAGCALPPAPKDQRVVLLSFQRGRDLVTASVAGGNETTWSGEVAVQPGDEKLWILAAADDAMIWRLTGAVDRVARFIVIPHYRHDLPAAGVVGLAADQVVFAKDPQCDLSDFLQSTRKDPQARSALLRDLLGRDPDNVVAGQAFLRVSVPDGKTQVKPEVEPERPAAVPEQLWHSLQRFGSGMPVAINAADAIAAGKAETYDVLPEEAGLLQLILDGAIVPRPAGTSTTEIDITEQGLVPRSSRDYIFEIVKPIARFPAGLSGGHSVVFQLAPGVPLPAGDPGHSCVRDGAGKILAGIKSLCNR